VEEVEARRRGMFIHKSLAELAVARRVIHRPAEAVRELVATGQRLGKMGEVLRMMREMRQGMSGG
jgi:hypothetical protein